MFAIHYGIYMQPVRKKTNVWYVIKSLRNRKYALSIWIMAAAGPEFFSPVPELLCEWCYLGRYVDV